MHWYSVDHLLMLFKLWVILRTFQTYEGLRGPVSLEECREFIQPIMLGKIGEKNTKKKIQKKEGHCKMGSDFIGMWVVHSNILPIHAIYHAPAAYSLLMGSHCTPPGKCKKKRILIKWNIMWICAYLQTVWPLTYANSIVLVHLHNESWPNWLGRRL